MQPTLWFVATLHPPPLEMGRVSVDKMVMVTAASKHVRWSAKVRLPTDPVPRPGC